MIQKLKTLRVRILVFLTHAAALPFLKMIRKPNPFPCSPKELAEMPKGRVGRDLADFMVAKNINLLPGYERHDMKHFLLGFDTTEEGEICMQCFMLGNGRISFPVLITVIFGIIFTPEYHLKMKQSYSNDKNATIIHDWDWFALLPQETNYVRNKIFNTKTGNQILL